MARRKSYTSGAYKAAFATTALSSAGYGAQKTFVVPVGAHLVSKSDKWYTDNRGHKRHIRNPLLADYHNTASKHDVRMVLYRIKDQGHAVAVASTGKIPPGARETLEGHGIHVAPNEGKHELVESGMIHTLVDDSAYWRHKAEKKGIKTYTPQQFVKNHGG